MTLPRPCSLLDALRITHSLSQCNRPNQQQNHCHVQLSLEKPLGDAVALRHTMRGGIDLGFKHRLRRLNRYTHIHHHRQRHNPNMVLLPPDGPLLERPGVRRQPGSDFERDDRRAPGWQPPMPPLPTARPPRPPLSAPSLEHRAQHVVDHVV